MRIRPPVPAAALALVIGGCSATDVAPSPAREAMPDVASPDSSPVDTVAAAVHAHAQGREVEGRGVVARVLHDDVDGSPHQKFLLRLADGTTVLVAHNIDLAPRLDGLATGDSVAFRGEYVWNPKGGTLHWTHRDPHGRHAAGWLRWRGRTYE